MTGIVLAGGRSSRFGRDKLAEQLNGRPLLHHTLLALAPAVDDLIVVIHPTVPAPSLPGPPELNRPVRIVRDPEPFGGPLVAFGAALEAARRPLALLVGGDMPGLRAAVLGALVAALDEQAADIAILAAGGPIQSLPTAVRVAPARRATAEAIAAGSGALRVLHDRLRLAIIPETIWRALDPDAATLRDIDAPGDVGAELG